jgi:hypothetical protein
MRELRKDIGLLEVLQRPLWSVSAGEETYFVGATKARCLAFIGHLYDSILSDEEDCEGDQQPTYFLCVDKSHAFDDLMFGSEEEAEAFVDSLVINRVGVLLRVINGDCG